MSDAPEENGSTALYERRPLAWWAIVIGCVIMGLSALTKAGCLVVS